MKKNVIVLIGLLILFSMSVVFADINIETIINDVEVSEGEFTFDSEVFEDEWSVDYNVETITFKPIFIENVDLSNIVVTINDDIVSDPVSVDSLLVYDEVAIPLTIGTNTIEMVVTETIETIETTVTYTYQVSRDSILEDMDVYVDGDRLELVPEFDSLTTTYENLIEMPEEIVFDYELGDLIQDKNYRVVITDDDEITIIENVNLELLDVNDYLKELFTYGRNTVTITIETEEDVVDAVIPTKEWILLEVYEFNFVINPINDVVIYTVDEDPLTDIKTLLELTPVFEINTFDYVGLVDTDVDSIDIIASLLGDLTEDDTVEIKINDVIYTATDIRNIPFTDEQLTLILQLTINEEVFLYTIDLYKKGYLEKLDFYYVNEKNVLVNLDMMPSYNQIDQPYEVSVPSEVNEVALQLELADDVIDMNLFINGVAYEAYHKVAVEYGQSVVLVEVTKDTVVIESYEITINRPKNLLGLEIAPIGDFGFDPEDYYYRIDVLEEVDVVTVTPTTTGDEDVYIDGVLLETATKEVALEFGKNTIEVTVVFDNTSTTYKVVIDRDKPINPNKSQNGYRFHYSDLDIDRDDDEFEFGTYAYRNIVQAFKWGNNQNNEIVIEASDDKGEINIPYHIYKFMTQRKVSFIIDFEDTEYVIDLSETKLNRYIRGSKSAEMIEIKFKIEDDDIIVETDIDFVEEYKHYNKDKDEEDDDDDDDDDDDNKPGNSGHSNGRNK